MSTAIRETLTRVPVLLLLLLLLAASTASCAGGAGQGLPDTAPAGDGVQEAQPGAIPFPGAAMDELALPEPLREASGQQVNYTFSALHPVAASANAAPDGPEMVVTSSGGRISYLIYRVTTAGSEPLELKVAAASAGSETWFGLANYEEGRFDFQPLASVAGQTIYVEDEKWLSPGGNLYFALVAYNGTQVRAANYQLRIHHGDTQIHEVVSTNGYEAISIISLNGRPGIFFYQGSDNALYFAHAKTAAPASSADWTISLVDGDGLPGLRHSACVYNGMPLVAFCTNGTGELRLAWCESGQPDGPEDWKRISIEDGSMPAGHSSIEIVGGQPAISYYVNDDADANMDGITGYVRYAYHLGSDLSEDWLSYTIAPSGGQSSEPSLAVVAGRPAIACQDTQSGKLTYLAADRAFPIAAGHWQSHDTGRAAAAGRVRLKDAGGRPVLLYPRPGSSSVSYMWGIDSDPADGAEWLENEQVGALLGLGQNFDLLTDDGRADIFGQYAVNLQDENGDPAQNRFTFIKRLFGNSFEPFVDFPAYVEFQGKRHIGGGYCAAWQGDVPVVAYMDSDGSKLMFGRLSFEQ